MPLLYSKVKALPPRFGITEEHIRVILKKADINCDGCLSKDELKGALREFGSHWPELRAIHCLWNVDANGDGRVNDDEFGVLVDYILATYSGRKKK